MEAAQEREAESWADSTAKAWGSSSGHWRPPKPWITEYERFATFVHSLPKATYWTKLPDALVLLWALPASAAWFTTTQQTHPPPNHQHSHIYHLLQLWAAGRAFDEDLHFLWPPKTPGCVLTSTGLPAHLHLDLQPSQPGWRRLFKACAFGTAVSASKIHEEW